VAAGVGEFGAASAVSSGLPLIPASLFACMT
jgi:hypothetical protein